MPEIRSHLDFQNDFFPQGTLTGNLAQRLVLNLSGGETEGQEIAGCLFWPNGTGPRADGLAVAVDVDLSVLGGLERLEPRAIKELHRLLGHSGDVSPLAIQLDSALQPVRLLLLREGASPKSLSQYGIVLHFTPPRCLWIYREGLLVQQLMHLRKESSYVIRRLDHAFKMQLRHTVGFDMGDNREAWLPEALWKASAQRHGGTLAILRPDSNLTSLRALVSRSLGIQKACSVYAPAELLRFLEYDGCTIIQPHAESENGFFVLDAGVYVSGPGGRHGTGRWLSEQHGVAVTVVVSQDGGIAWYQQGEEAGVDDRLHYRDSME